MKGNMTYSEMKNELKKHGFGGIAEEVSEKAEKRLGEIGDQYQTINQQALVINKHESEIRELLDVCDEDMETIRQQEEALDELDMVVGVMKIKIEAQADHIRRLEELRGIPEFPPG